MKFLTFLLLIFICLINSIYSAPQFYGPPRYGYGGYRRFGGYGGYYDDFGPRWRHHMPPPPPPPPPPPMIGPPQIVRTTVVKTITTTVG
uniref:Uncharacterized protein n=1 Tax=Strongyloides stercoralis TaxID=6248 RepID=A0A0K0E4H9_STRER